MFLKKEEYVSLFILSFAQKLRQNCCNPSWRRFQDPPCDEFSEMMENAGETCDAVTHNKRTTKYDMCFT